MPYLQKDGVFYEGLVGKKYNDIKAEILKMYVKSLEKASYPMHEIYPTREAKVGEMNSPK